MAKLPPEMPQRLLAANRALECFAEGTMIFHQPQAPGAGFYVSWRPCGTGFPEHRRWIVRRGQDFYPVWYRYWGHGGTATTALAQLIRWCQGRPVLPLTTWLWWMTPSVNLGRDRGAECIEALRDGNYPETANCVLCEQPITAGMDWWSLNKISGPCCGMRSGCHQKGRPFIAELAKQSATRETMMEGAA